MGKILSGEEDAIYRKTMDVIACDVFYESLKAVSELHEAHLNPLESHKEIGMAMGQKVLDDIINVTEDMPKEALVRWFAEVAINHVVMGMDHHPAYKEYIIKQLGL